MSFKDRIKNLFSTENFHRTFMSVVEPLQGLRGPCLLPTFSKFLIHYVKNIFLYSKLAFSLYWPPNQIRVRENKRIE